MVRRSLSLWMLVFVLIAACCGAAGAQQFQDIAPALGIPGAIGAAWGDYDGDGYADLFLTGNTAVGYAARLLKNDGGLSFTDATASVGIATAFTGQIGPAWGDYNNDGLLDLFVASDGQAPQLYRNDGGHFTDAASEAGLTGLFTNTGGSRTSSWCDYDGDGWLDLFVCAGDARLLHNEGDGTFTDATASAGMTGDAQPTGAHSSAWGDYDNDGRPDLIVTRPEPLKPLLYHNKGDGTFTNVGAFLAVVTTGAGMAWGDYDNDGWLDLYITTSVDQARDWLFHNNGDGTFTDVAASAGLAADVSTSDSVAWADYDNDGYLDIYVGNTQAGGASFLYHNNGDGTFTSRAALEGMAGTYHDEAAAWADMNLDGKLDLMQAGQLISRLFSNIGFAGNALRVRALTSATGDATSGGPVRDAIGARVEVNLDNDDAFTSGRTLTRLIDGGSGFLAQGEQVAHFGVGYGDLINPVVAVRVLFPDGSVVVHRDVQANQQLTIRDVPADRTELFRDVPLDFWAYPQIRAAVNGSVVFGYSDGTYQPAQPVTRAQMAVFIARSMLIPTGDPAVPEGPPTATFGDVPNTGYGPSGTDPYWAYKYIEYCVAQDVVRGYEGGIYDPEGIVTRDQMAVFVARAKGWVHLGDDMTTAPEVFPDVPAGHWAGTAVQACVDHDVVQGYDDGKYHPEYQVTRDQMAVYVQRAFGLPL